MRIAEFDTHVTYICLRFRLPFVGVSQSTVIPENFIYFCLVRVLIIVTAVERFCDPYAKMHSSHSDGFLENHLNSKVTVKIYQLFEQDGCTVEGERGNDTLSNFEWISFRAFLDAFPTIRPKKSRPTFFAMSTLKSAPSHCHVSSGAKFSR